MKFSERLHDFMGSVLGMGLSAPDNYSSLMMELYGTQEEAHKKNVMILQEDWQALRPLIKRDVDKIPFIEERMKAALANFAEGQSELGRALLMEIYKLPLRKIR